MSACESRPVCAGGRGLSAPPAEHDGDFAHDAHPTVLDGNRRRRSGRGFELPAKKPILSMFEDVGMGEAQAALKNAMNKKLVPTGRFRPAHWMSEPGRLHPERRNGARLQQGRA
jgi:hypothetical protein